jgi:hypothetical protein
MSLTLTVLFSLLTASAESDVRRKVILSRPFHVDREYRSMQGPHDLIQVQLLDTGPPQLMWITGFSAEMMDGEGQDTVSQGFMCHSNLDVEPRTHRRDFQSRAAVSGRLFTLSQGQQEISFPPGFGLPVMSDTPMDLVAQVLNLNHPDLDLDVRHRVTIEYVPDSALTTPMIPLFQAGVSAFKSLEEIPVRYGVPDGRAQADHHGPGCSIGLAAEGGTTREDRVGQRFTDHWVVPPGREENRTYVSKFLQLRFNSTIHYIAVHLHPFAESLELIDLTEGKTVFRAEAEQTLGEIGLAHVDHFASIEGIPIYKNHHYELVSVYDNSSEVDQDSMAVMFLYLRDKRFRKPRATSASEN